MYTECVERERERVVESSVNNTNVPAVSKCGRSVCVCVCVFVGSHPAACDISGKAEERLQRLSH